MRETLIQESDSGALEYVHRIKLIKFFFFLHHSSCWNYFAVDSLACRSGNPLITPYSCRTVG